LLAVTYGFWSAYPSACPPCPVGVFQNENSKFSPSKCPFYTFFKETENQNPYLYGLN